MISTPIERAVPSTSIIAASSEADAHILEFILRNFFHLRFGEFAYFISVRHFRTLFDAQFFEDHAGNRRLLRDKRKRLV